MTSIDSADLRPIHEAEKVQRAIDSTTASAIQFRKAPILMNRLAILFPMLVALGTAIGCSDSSGTDAGSIGKSIGKNVTEFAQGVGTGVDGELQIKIELSETLTQSGLSATVAKQQSPLNDPQKAISVYFIATKELNATLIAKAYSTEDLEIGRATADVSFHSDDAQYISFAFPSEMDRQLVAIYRIDVRATTPDGNKEQAAEGNL